MEAQATQTPCEERKASVVRGASGTNRLKLSSHSSMEDHESRAVRALKVRAASVSAKAGGGCKKSL